MYEGTLLDSLTPSHRMALPLKKRGFAMRLMPWSVEHYPAVPCAGLEVAKLAHVWEARAYTRPLFSST